MKAREFCKKWIGLLLAVAMILAGVCLEKGRADSAFLYIDSSALKSHMYYIENMVSDNDSCTAEQLGVKSVQGIVSGQKSVENNIRAIWCLLFLAILPQIPTQVKRENVRAPERALLSGQQVIICYIHKQDGEKGASVIL